MGYALRANPSYVSLHCRKKMNSALSDLPSSPTLSQTLVVRASRLPLVAFRPSLTLALSQREREQKRRRDRIQIPYSIKINLSPYRIAAHPEVRPPAPLTPGPLPRGEWRGEYPCRRFQPAAAVKDSAMVPPHESRGTSPRAPTLSPALRTGV